MALKLLVYINGYLNILLIGVVEAKTGDSFFYKFSHLDTPRFEKFLELFSQTYPARDSNHSTR